MLRYEAEVLVEGNWSSEEQRRARELFNVGLLLEAAERLEMIGRADIVGFCKSKDMPAEDQVAMEFLRCRLESGTMPVRPLHKSEEAERVRIDAAIEAKLKR